MHKSNDPTRRRGHVFAEKGSAPTHWLIYTQAPSPPSDSLHSSDIAFKPNNDGWGGGNPQYASNYDRIFGNKNGSTKKAAPEQTAPQPAAQALDARDALALRRILRESGESSTLKEILEAAGWRRS